MKSQESAVTELTHAEQDEIRRLSRLLVNTTAEEASEPWLGALGLATAVAEFVSFNVPNVERRYHHLKNIHEWMREVARDYDGGAKMQ